MVRKLAVLAVAIAALFFTVSSFAVMTVETESFLRNHNEVKVFVDIKNASGDEKVNIELLKTSLESAFAGRKAHKFTIVKTAEEADMILRGNVVEYVWSESDPIDQVWGLGSAAMDAAMQENYARIQADMQLVAAKGMTKLWSDRVQATMTKGVMPKDESYAQVYGIFTKTIMKEMFKERDN